MFWILPAQHTKIVSTQGMLAATQITTYVGRVSSPCATTPPPPPPRSAAGSPRCRTLGWSPRDTSRSAIPTISGWTGRRNAWGETEWKMLYFLIFINCNPTSYGVLDFTGLRGGGLFHLSPHIYLLQQLLIGVFRACVQEILENLKYWHWSKQW